MKWIEESVAAIKNEQLFQSTGHESRFRELLDVYSSASFFTPGLMKCMFMSAWDDEHFFQMLEMMNQLTLKNNKNLDDMSENGELMVEEIEDSDRYCMALSCAFVDNTPFDVGTLPEDIDPGCRHIITVCLQAADIIDSKSAE